MKGWTGVCSFLSKVHWMVQRTGVFVLFSGWNEAVESLAGTKRWHLQLGESD